MELLEEVSDDETPVDPVSPEDAQA
jgi:hypothetical protein